MDDKAQSVPADEAPPNDAPAAPTDAADAADAATGDTATAADAPKIADAATADTATTADTPADALAPATKPTQPPVRRTKPADRADVGASFVGPIWVTLLTVLFTLVTAFLLYSVISIWPISADTGVTAAGPGAPASLMSSPEPSVEPDASPAEEPTAIATASPAPVPAAGTTASELRPSEFLGHAVTLDIDRAYFLVVVLAGAIGAMLHVLRSFYEYVGERKLRWSWVPSYFILPFIGAILAAITYVVLRAGLLSGPVALVGNPFGFAAVGALVGLFSRQANKKLKLVFEAAFASDSSGKESLDTDSSGDRSGSDDSSGDGSGSDDSSGDEH